MDWLSQLLGLGLTAFRLLNEAIKFISEAQGPMRKSGEESRRR